MADPVTIEMFLDVSCPWCHGALETNRRLLDELAADPAVPPLELQWRFMRLHELPRPGGVPLEEYYGSWGDASPEALERARGEVRSYATSVGVLVDFSRYTFLHDPELAHRLLAAVRDDAGDDLPSLWSLARAIFSANFHDGADIADVGALRAAVERAGLLLPERVWESLASEERRAAPVEDRARAQEVELDGVPRMYVNRVIVPTWVDAAEVRARLREAIARVVPASPA